MHIRKMALRWHESFNERCIRAWAAFSLGVGAHSRELLFFLGIGLLYSSGDSYAHAGSGSYGMACNGLLLLVEGTFGALITAAAGVGAIVASAVGGFKTAWTLLVVSVGAFILRSYISLFNGECAAAAVINFPCDGGC